MLNTIYKFNIGQKEITTIESNAVLLREGETAAVVDGESVFDPSNSPYTGRAMHHLFIINFIHIRRKYQRW